MKLSLDPIDTTIITPNNRLAEYLRRQYAKEALQANLSVWQAPNILPYHAWLEIVWNTAVPSGEPLPVLLNSVQEQELWRIAIESWLKNNKQELLNVAAASRSSRGSWQTMRSYNALLADLDKYKYELNEDHLAWGQWCEEFQNQCQKGHCIPPYEISHQLTELLKAKQILYIDIPNRVRFVGFSERTPAQEQLVELTPAQKKLVEALRAAGHQVTFDNPNEAPGRFCLAAKLSNSGLTSSFDSPIQEIEQAIFWAAEKLKSSPTATAAIIVPNLQDNRLVVQYALEDLLKPDIIFNPGKTKNYPFDISLGQNLNEFSLAAYALKLLEFCSSPLKTAEVVSLVNCPYLAGADDERYSRARFSDYLRTKRRAKWSLSALRDTLNKYLYKCQHPTPNTAQTLDKALPTGKDAGLAAQQPSAPAPVQHDDPVSLCPKLREILNNLAYRVAEFSDLSKPSQWCEAFGKCLELAGWPGQRPLSSSDHQVQQRFTKTLFELTTLDYVHPELTAMQTWRILSSTCSNIVFQPESDKARLQIMGVQEAAGLRFDYAWITGLDHTNWPARLEPLRFVPLEWQQDLHIPGAVPAEDLQRSILATHGLLQTASEGIISYANNRLGRGDTEHLRLSPLLTELSLALDPPLIEQTPRYAEQCFAEQKKSGQLEETCEQAPPELPENSEVDGGYKVYSLQSQCPFRAFTELRLQIRGPEEQKVGLDPTERGTLLHDVMEKVWKELGDQTALMDLTEDGVDALVERIVNGFAEGLQSKHVEVAAEICQLELELVKDLATQWLKNVERKRTNRFEVFEVEAEHTINLHGLQIKARVDRVDQLEDGSYAIIDYKTGETNIKKWDCPRPDDPQLPLYALYFQQEHPNSVVEALAYAEIKAKHIRFNGLSRLCPDFAIDATSTSAKKTTSALGEDGWKARMDDWEKALGDLAQAFKDGKYPVAPNKNACKYCRLQPFCRIYAKTLTLESPELEEE